MPKQNCWEVRKCGREPGGEKSKELGVCPAAVSGEGDVINGGKNRGRICWYVGGTLCGGKVQGTYAKKMKTCRDCPFFEQVQKEEGDDLRMAVTYL